MAGNPETLQKVKRALDHYKVPYREAKTWTTDGIYRETKDKVARRRSEGCVTVKMETSALFVVAGFRGVELAQILYGGDDLSQDVWDRRTWNKRDHIRANLVDPALESVLWL